MSYAGTPRGKNVLIEPVSATHSSSAFCLLPGMSQREKFGYIRALGPRCAKDLEVGQLVLYDEFAAYGATVKLYDSAANEIKEMLLLEDADIRLHLSKAD
jgi:hypothetical protein